MSELAASPRRWRTAFFACLVLAVTCAAYLPSLRNGFTNWDDPYYVTANTAIHSLSWPAVKLIFSSSVLGMYHPLSILSLAGDYHYFGLDPRGYHAVNLALHLANTLLVFGLLRLLCGNLAAAVAGSLLFGVHPLHVESVAWIAERKDLLCAFFYLGALGAYLRRCRAARPEAWYVLALVLLTASLLSKPMGVTFPLVLYLCDYLQGRSPGWRTHLEKLPFIALALLFAAITLFPVGLPGPDQVPLRFTADNLFVAAYGLIFYLGKALLPLRLSALYPYPETAVAPIPLRFLLSPVAAALIGLAVVRSARRSRIVPFGFLFFTLTLLPVLAVRIGPHFAADRYFYLPSFGLCYLGGIAFSRLLDGVGRSARVRAAALIALTLVAITFSLLTWRRTQVWRDSLTLWNDVIATHPEPSVAYLSRGLERFARGDAEGSVGDLTVYLRLSPFDAAAYKSRGTALLQAGGVEAALEDFDRAISLKPDFAEALNNRGALLANRGELVRAIGDFTRALNANPSYRAALVNRAKARETLGDHESAGQDREAALALEP